MITTATKNRFDLEAVAGSESRGDSAGARNSCRLCAPLGACAAFLGLESCVPVLHGSQGCATYIRRYMISHFREPVDVGSSSFSEEDAIFGGVASLAAAIDNIVSQYHPAVVGVATTCLAETIGEDSARIRAEIRSLAAEHPAWPLIVPVSTPSYSGGHIDGFHATVRAMVESLAENVPTSCGGVTVNLFPGFVSPEDLRWLKKTLKSLGVNGIILPDYSETLDGGPWTGYEPIRPGGCPIVSVRSMGSANASLELGVSCAATDESPGTALKRRFGVPVKRLGLPIGARETDLFLDTVSELAHGAVSDETHSERARLVDAAIDAHKVLSGRRVAIVADPDMAAGLASFMDELGCVTALCASGTAGDTLTESLRRSLGDKTFKEIKILSDTDHAAVEYACRGLELDLMIGGSKCYAASRRLGVPLVRVGFPIHDRHGGQRMLHLGYEGALRLLDQIANTLVAAEQERSSVGYTYF